MVPMIGVIDTDSDPEWVDYVIPANDDSLTSLHFLTRALAAAVAEGASRQGSHQRADRTSESDPSYGSAASTENDGAVQL